MMDLQVKCGVFEQYSSELEPGLDSKTVSFLGKFLRIEFYPTGISAGLEM